MSDIKISPVIAGYVILGGVGLYIAWKVFDMWDSYTTGLATVANNYAFESGVSVSQSVYDTSNLYYKAQRDYSKASGLIDGGQNWPSLYAWESGDIGPVGYTYGSANYPKISEASVGQTILSILSGGV